jgi:RND family efflux transporter MFP subunit
VVLPPGLLSLAARAGIVAAFALLAVSCGGEANSQAEDNAPPPPVQIGTENVITVKRDTIEVGPMISGELKAVREATVRAELGGAVLQVNVDEGQPVKRGTLLARIEAKTQEDARRSAESAVRSAENQVAVAQREAERTDTLVSAGALATRDLDITRNNVTTAEAQLADARARLVAATKELGDAVLRAPIDGIVAKRSVNTGDVVTTGSELFTIIDPSSMRLEGSVPSENLGELRIGAPVVFEVRGYEQRLQGRIERIAPQADPATRQVPIYVALPNVGGTVVAGLFAEGRVVSQSADGLVVPINAVNTSGGMPWVIRVAGGKTERVSVTPGLRDPKTERMQITAGLNDGDVLLRGAAQGITPGTPVQVNTQ